MSEEIELNDIDNHPKEEKTDFDGADYTVI